MSRVTPPTDQSIDREVAKTEADRAGRMVLALTSIVAYAATFIGVADLMLSDQAPNGTSSAPSTAKDLVPLVEV